jgi:hypothetical protein
VADERDRIVRDYVTAFARDGSRHYIANLGTDVKMLAWGEHLLPLTVNNGERAETFVCSPRVGYIDYPLEELSRFPNRHIVPALHGIISIVGAVLSLSDVDRVVHLNNWMMSTNLPVALDPTLVTLQTEQLVAHHPKHLLAMRSLTRRYNAPLIDALGAAGWVLLPSRQVFLVDDVARDSFKRRDTRRDDKLWRQGRLTVEEGEALSTADAQRIVTLYAMLYLDKYSRLNPHYTAEFVMLTQRIGMIRYLVLRDENGLIQGFGGMHRLGQYATMPLIGYNTLAPQNQGLYRLTFHAGSLYAAKHGLKFNMSSGATAFKRTRGATAEMEFTAYYLRHLPMIRRLPFDFLRWIAMNVGMPLLAKYEL